LPGEEEPFVRAAKGRKAAKADDAVPVALPEQAESSRRFGSLRISGFSVLLGALIVGAIVILAPGLRTFIEQRQQISDLQAKVDAQKQEVASLTDERARWNDASYVRAQSRERLFYVLPGEISYLVINDVDAGAAVQTQAPISTDIQTTRVDWLQQLYVSTMVAGLGELTPDQLQGPTTG
jgi:cell division protein FtsB